MPIPNDWDGTSFCDYAIRWPNSQLWRVILRGLLNNPALEMFWDTRTGNVSDILEEFEPTLNHNLDSLECGDMTIPIGTIFEYAGYDPPSDSWLMCDGSPYDIVYYPDLYSLIGTAYGSSGPGTFRVPNKSGRVGVGRDIGQSEFDVLGETGGAKTVALTTAEMPSHTHVQNSHNHTQDAHGHTIVINGAQVRSAATGGSGANNVNNDSGQNVGGNQWLMTNATATNQAATATNQNAGGGGAHNNLPPYIILNYIIKAKK